MTLELMSPFFAALTSLRKVALSACVVWFLIFLYLGGPMGLARLLSQRTVLEIFMIQGINSIFSAFVIVELLRGVSKRAARWTDRTHFSVVGAFWCLLTVLTSAGVLLARSSVAFA
jgi:hypothetical protein